MLIWQEEPWIIWLVLIFHQYLWTKLPGSKSAGRVQSVALKLLTEREHEIEIFKPDEFWTLNVNFNTKDNSKN